MNGNNGKILLINPGHEGKLAIRHSVPHKIHRDIPPVSILVLGSYLKKHGFDIILLDTHIDQNYKNTIRTILSKENIILVGITALIGKFITNAQEITAYVKSISKKTPVVWGGALTSTLPEACLKEGKADYIVFLKSVR